MTKNLDADAMRAEAAEIAGRRTDVIRADVDTPADVIVTLGEYPPGAQVCVRHRSYGVDVDYRERPTDGWSPIAFWGGSVEIRPQSVDLLPCQEDVGRTDEVRNGATVTVIHGGAA